MEMIMSEDLDFQALDALVGQFFNITNRVISSQNQPFSITYRGILKSKDSEKSFENLSAGLTPFGLIPRFYYDKGNQVIQLIHLPPKTKPTNARINLILFIATLLSVLFTGGLISIKENLPTDWFQAISIIISKGWPFALSLLAILAAHEFGHFFAGKRNGVQVTLPYFIPMPLSAFGTMGAFINMRSLPKNKKALFDLSITGPLCGFLVSIMVLLIGLNLSTVEFLPENLGSGISLQMEGNSLLYLGLKYVVFGKLLPNPSNLSGIPLIVFWLQYFFTGHPFPWNSLDVILHPVAWAGWAGLFVTTINLLPVGQLDGGHIFSTAFGIDKTRQIFPIIIAGLILLGFFWTTWWIWAALLLLMGRFYAEPLDQITPLDNKRKRLAWLAVAIFLLTFIPVPLMIVQM